MVNLSMSSPADLSRVRASLSIICDLGSIELVRSIRGWFSKDYPVGCEDSSAKFLGLAMHE